MEGQEYISINPGTLSDPELWSYQDLQKIAKTVGLRANTRREELVNSLIEWNRCRKDGTKTLVEDSVVTASSSSSISTVKLDMNVVGNNFAILAVKVQAAPESAASPIAPCHLTGSPVKSLKRKVSSMVGFGLGDETDDDIGIVNSTYLRPLRPQSATPGKSCLKRISSYCETYEDDHLSENSDPLTQDSQNIDPVMNTSTKSTDSVSSTTSTTTDTMDSVELTVDCYQNSGIKLPSSRNPNLSTNSTVRRLPNICFSPFNGVKVIAHRIAVEAAYAEEEELQREMEGEGDDMDSYWYRAFW